MNTVQSKAEMVLGEAEKEITQYSGIGVEKIVEHGSSAGDKIIDIAEGGKYDMVHAVPFRTEARLQGVRRIVKAAVDHGAVGAAGSRRQLRCPVQDDDAHPPAGELAHQARPHDAPAYDGDVKLFAEH